jgi:hypothetical protein
VEYGGGSERWEVEEVGASRTGDFIIENRQRQDGKFRISHVSDGGSSLRDVCTLQRQGVKQEYECQTH